MPCINYGLWDFKRNRINNGSNRVRLITRFVYDTSDSCKTIIIYYLLWRDSLNGKYTISQRVLRVLK